MTPQRVAKPSPKARKPHPAAARGRRCGKRRTSDEDDERVEEDADRVAAGPVVASEESASSEAREDEEVEREGAESAERGSPPVEPTEEKRERRHPDVDGLPFRLRRVEAHSRAASARSRRCSSSASVKCRGASPVSRS